MFSLRALLSLGYLDAAYSRIRGRKVFLVARSDAGAVNLTLDQREFSARFRV
jgi:hypothetical protein